MWCFSYKCNWCSKPINSSSFDGDVVEIVLMDGDKKVEEMYWKYDSYWRVFDENMDSIEWDISWDEVCDKYMFWSGKYIMHCDNCVKKWDVDYSYWSESDPDQWWGWPWGMWGCNVWGFMWRKKNLKPYHIIYE